MTSTRKYVMSDIVERIEDALGQDTFWDTDALPLLSDAFAEIRRLRNERCWIPVSERLPEEDVDVLVMTNYGMHVADLDEDGTWNASHGDSWQFPEPTHWMPLPEPPEAGDADATHVGETTLREGSVQVDGTEPERLT